MGNKRKLLFIIPAQAFFLENGMGSDIYKLRSIEAGPDIVNSELDRDKYDVTYIDFDALLIKKYRNQNPPLTDCLAVMMPKESYDYILVSMPHLSLQITPNVLLLLVKYIETVNAKYPDVKFVLGGNILRLLIVMSSGPMSPGPFCFLATHSPVKFQPFYDCEFDELKESYNLRMLNDFTNIIDYSEMDSLNKEVWDDLTTKSNPNQNNRIHNDRYRFSILSKPHNLRFDNIDDLRYTYRDILDLMDLNTDLIPSEQLNKNVIVADVLFSSGCPFQCAFCSSDRYSSIKIDQMVDVIKSKLDMGHQYLNIYDFLCNPYIEKLSNSIIQQNLKLRWKTSLELTLNSTETYQAMFEAGCRCVDVGTESANDSVLNRVNKKNTIDNMTDNLKMIHNAGMMIGANFIIDFPYETVVEFTNTLKYIKEHQDILDQYQINMLMMKKGTSLYNNAEKNKTQMLSWNDSYGIQVETDNGLTVEENFEMKKVKWDLLKSFFIKNNLKKISPYAPLHSVFMLYEIFDDDKRKVTDWLKKHYHSKIDISKLPDYPIDEIKKYLTKLVRPV